MYYKKFKNEDIQKADVKMSKDIIFFRQAIELTYDIINIMRPLHGKVYNVRVRDVIKSIPGNDKIHYYVSTAYKSDCVSFSYDYNHNVSTSFNIETFIPEGGTAPRFDATATINNAMENVKKLECRINGYMETRKNIENIYEELNAIFERLEEIDSSIDDYTLKRYYGLNYYVHFGY